MRAAFFSPGARARLGFNAVALTIVAAASPAALAAQRITVGPNVQISAARARDAHSEPVIAADPKNAQRLIAGSHIAWRDTTGTKSIAYVSFDGGESWDGPNAVPYLREDLTAGGDPVVAFTRDGAQAYMGYISIGIDEFNLGPIETAAQVSSMAVAVSDDGGLTWPTQVSAARSRVDTTGLETDRFGRLRGTITAGFLDKPWMATGPDPGLAVATAVRVAVSHYLVRSDDDADFLAQLRHAARVKSHSP